MLTTCATVERRKLCNKIQCAAKQAVIEQKREGRHEKKSVAALLVTTRCGGAHLGYCFSAAQSHDHPSLSIVFQSRDVHGHGIVAHTFKVILG